MPKRLSENVVEGKMSGSAEPVDYVNTLVGTMSKPELSAGNTYPAVALPWGMNAWTPMTGKRGDGWTYTYTADKITGLKLTHQPSPWINDYGQLIIFPFTIDNSDSRGDDRAVVSTGNSSITKSSDWKSASAEFGNRLSQEVESLRELASWFSHKSETATPYYYSVYLADFDVFAELAPTERAASLRFTYRNPDNACLLIDALDGDAAVNLSADLRRVTGYSTKNSGGVPDNFKLYFVIDFDSPVLAEYAENGSLKAFGFGGRKTVNAKVAASFISEEQALRNLEEVGGMTLEETAHAGRARWNEALSRIEVEDDNIDNLRTFYSCLYRSLLFPRAFYEIDASGKPVHYSPYNGQVLPGRIYTDTGFWDTFRSLFPLLNLVYPERAAEMQEGLANAYLESGFLPEWASPGHRGCMVGNNSASVVADAYLSGVRTPYTETLWEAVVKGSQNVHPDVSSTGRLGHEYYDSLGYVPCDKGINESAARTLEYAYDDWCIHQFGKALGKPASETERFGRNALNYRNLFEAETGLMRGRKTDGSFQTPFNPLKWGDAFTEGNAWHYTWSVFHDPAGLAKLMGGPGRMSAMLDSVFALPPLFDESYYGFVIHEIREMQIMNMGNYAHGNQPIQHMIYLYNWTGEPWKSQQRAREVMDKFYKPTPDGYCGDEDNGQTSAWYVFSALGFYPVCPGSGQYALGSPLFRKAVIYFPDGKKSEISTEGKGPYIRSVQVDGRNWRRNYITMESLRKGSALRFEMSEEPEKSRGTTEADFPYSFSKQ